MPQDKLSMRKIRDVLRYRHSTGLSLEAIARALILSSVQIEINYPWPSGQAT